MNKLHDPNIFPNEDNRIVIGKMFQLEFIISMDSNLQQNTILQAVFPKTIMSKFTTALHGEILLGVKSSHFIKGVFHIMINWPKLLEKCKLHIPLCFEKKPIETHVNGADDLLAQLKSLSQQYAQSKQSTKP